MNLKFKTPVPSSLDKVKSGFNKKLFEFLTPPWVSIALERFDGCKTHDEIHLKMKQAGLTQQWVSVVTSEEESTHEWSFVDEGKLLPWPLKKWRHHHRVIKTSETAVEIVDDIFYQCSPKILGVIIYPVLWSTFAIRPSRYVEYFKS